MKKVVRWLVRLVAFSIASAGILVMLKDLYNHYFDPGILVRNAIVRSLDAKQAKFSLFAELKPMERSFPIWTMTISDGVSKRLEEPLHYDASSTIDVRKKHMLQTMGGVVEGIYRSGVLGLNVDIEEPFDEPLLLPLRQGWVEFSAAKDHEQVFWDTYLPIPLRQRLFASSEILIEEFAHSNIFTSGFRFQPDIWFSLLRRRPVTMTVSMSKERMLEFLQTINQRIQQQELTRSETEKIQAALDLLARWSLLTTIDESGKITKVKISGQTDDREISLSIDISYPDPDTEPVSLLFVNGALPYREALKVLSGVQRIFVMNEEPTETEVRQLLGYWSFQEDQDEDGLVDAHESFFGTDPLQKDTDGDGFSDRDELIHGFSPFASKQQLYD